MITGPSRLDGDDDVTEVGSVTSPASADTFADLLPGLAQADARQATRHIEVLHANQSGYLSTVLLRAPRQEHHHFVALDEALQRVNGQDASDSVDALSAVVSAGWNVYVACAAFKAVPAPNTRGYVGRGSRADVLTVPGVWADLDVKPGVESAFQTETELEEYLRKLPPTTMEVASGSGGRHAYWLTTEPLPVITAGTVLPAWLDLLRAVADDIAIDNVQDTTRILRLAGTVRWPKQGDAQSAIPRKVELIKDSGPRYKLAELKLHSQYAAREAQDRRNAERSKIGPINHARRSTVTRAGMSELNYDQLLGRFNTMIDWSALLERAHWSLFGDFRDSAARCRYWTRPGKSAADGKSASTDWIEDDGTVSKVMIIYSMDPSLDKLRENRGTSDAHGICSKWNFARVMFTGDETEMVMLAHTMLSERHA